jgi:hypothetical protein
MVKSLLVKQRQVKEFSTILGFNFIKLVLFIIQNWTTVIIAKKKYEKLII